MKSDPGERLCADFHALCSFGGRLAGTEGERKALAFLEQRGQEVTGRPAKILPVTYGGWSAIECSLSMLLDREVAAPCHPLVRTISSPEGGLIAEVIDLGRGIAEDFNAHSARIAGRIVLVRHEYMFADDHLHRWRKYQLARKYGAVGFMISPTLPGGVLVTGSSSRIEGDGIPAIGIGSETAAQLSLADGPLPRVRIKIKTEEKPATTKTLVFDLPARGYNSQEVVVLSAHVDGHDLAESAMDNASGVAVALIVAHNLASSVEKFRRGLRVCFFSAEEWALIGSSQYIDGLPQSERDRITLNVNLDSVGGSPNLSALTSDFIGVEPFLCRVAAECGQALHIHRPAMVNSDHANFARVGIPAIRLVAGFNETSSNLRYVLTQGDTRDKVATTELLSAAALTTAIVAAACTAPDEVARSFRRTS
jgi:hypothetical protein